MHFQKSYLLVILSLLTAHLSRAEDMEDTKGLNIDLISESKTIVPGKPFTVGIHIKHDKGFHTYWKSPGMVGMATQLEWKLPEGFTTSGIQWPYPENCYMAEYPCHGYERDVTLLVDITPPAQINTESVELSVTASWMCCADVCNPGSKDLKLTLPVSTETTPDATAAALINKARGEMPKADPQWKAELLSKAGAAEIKVQIFPPEKIATDSLYLFSEDGQISSSEKQNSVVQADGSIVFTLPRSEYDATKSANLPLILKAPKQYVSIRPMYKSLQQK